MYIAHMNIFMMNKRDDKNITIITLTLGGPRWEQKIEQLSRASHTPDLIQY